MRTGRTTANKASCLAVGLGVVFAGWTLDEARGACREQGRAKANQLGAQALAKGKARDWSAARTAVDKALAVAVGQGCQATRTAARLYVLQGVIRLVGLRDRSGALASWRRAVSIWSAVPLPAAFRWPGVVRRFAKVPRSGGATPPPEPARPPAPVHRVRPRPAARKPPPRRPPVRWTLPPRYQRAPARPGPRPRVRLRVAPPPTAMTPRLPRPRHQTDLPPLPVPRHQDSPPLASRRLKPLKAMPEDASLYGLGSRLAWIRYRRAKRRRAWSTALLWTGILGQLGFGSGSMVLLLKHESHKTMNSGWALLGMTGLCQIIMWVGVGLRSGTSPTQAGLLLFTTEPVTGARIVPTLGGVAVTGGF